MAEIEDLPALGSYGKAGEDENDDEDEEEGWRPGVADAIAAWHTKGMSTKLIEQHLTDLQRRVASLEAAVKPGPRDAWKQIIGISKGQSLDRAAARLGAEWRAKENKRK